MYKEWRGKNVLVVTYGGHGGNKCGDQLRTVLEGGLKMSVIGSVGITLPVEYIKGNKRIGVDTAIESTAGEELDFLAAAKTELKDGLRRLIITSEVL